jgi:putative FmdB family regulatory protein
MPVYEYQCDGCGRKFDVIATLAEKDAGLHPVCPKCGLGRTRQVFGRFTLLTGSKSEADDFGSGDDGAAAGMPDLGGMDDDFGDEGLDSLDGSGDLDDI